MGIMLQPVGVGLLSLALEQGSNAKINGFLALCGVSVGLCFGPLVSILGLYFTRARDLLFRDIGYPRPVLPTRKPRSDRRDAQPLRM